MRRYAMEGAQSRSLLTYRGAVIVHTSRDELEWLIPGVRVVDCPRDIEHTIWLRDHPGMASVRWPLRKDDFR